MQLRSDPLVDVIQRLAPEIRVHGGSFSHWLQPPWRVVRSARRGALERARQDATRQCLSELLAGAGLPAIEPGRSASGERVWPDGYIGSVSHKAARVVAALAPSARMRFLGVDIEHRDGAEDLSRIPGLTATANLPQELVEWEPVILFSVKEAVFKAVHRSLGRRIDFDDVAVSWTAIHAASLRGTAHCAGIGLEVRCSAAVAPWLASVALASETA